MEKKKTDYKKKVDRAMTGCSWEEAREIGVSILGRISAFYAYRDGDFDYVALLKEIVNSGDKWIKEEGGAGYVAMAKMGLKQEAERKKKTVCKLEPKNDD